MYLWCCRQAGRLAISHKDQSSGIILYCIVLYCIVLYCKIRFREQFRREVLPTNSVRFENFVPFWSGWKVEIQAGGHTTSYKQKGTSWRGRSCDVIMAGNGLSVWRLSSAVNTLCLLTGNSVSRQSLASRWMSENLFLFTFLQKWCSVGLVLEVI